MRVRLRPLLSLLALAALSWALAAGPARAQERAQARAQERAAPPLPPSAYRIAMVTWRGWTDTDQGFKDYFAARRLPVRLTVFDAGRDKTRLPRIVAEIKAMKPDLVYAWGTSAALGVFGRADAADKGAFIDALPGVFCNVSHPVQSGLVPSLEGSGRNIAGSTFLVPLEDQIRAMRSYRPFSTLAVIYNPLEENSREVVAALTALSRHDGFRLLARPLPVDSGKPVGSALPRLVAMVAARHPGFLYIPPDSFLSAHKVALTEAAAAAGLPTFAAAEGTLKGSAAMMGLISRYYNIGQLTGSLAEKILRDHAHPGRMKVVSLSRYSLILNMATVRRLKIYPPLSLLKVAEIEDWPTPQPGASQP